MDRNGEGTGAVFMWIGAWKVEWVGQESDRGNWADKGREYL